MFEKPSTFSTFFKKVQNLMVFQTFYNDHETFGTTSFYKVVTGIESDFFPPSVYLEVEPLFQTFKFPFFF